MKLRVRILRQTIKVDLPGPEPGLKDLTDHIRDSLLSAHGLSESSQFGVSLNGSEVLTESGQTLSSCGIVSGDLVCVVLPESAVPRPPESSTRPPESSSRPPESSTRPPESSSRPPESSTGTTSSRPPESSTRPPESSTGTSSSSETQTLQQTSEVLVSGSSGSSGSRGSTGSSGPPGLHWEPMLVCEAEDQQAPLALQTLFQSSDPRSPEDAVMTAAHLLMLESGFLPQIQDQDQVQDQVQVQDQDQTVMPPGWRSPGLYRVSYRHPLCEGSTILLVGVSMGPLLVLNATLKVNSSVGVVRKLSVSPCDFVTGAWPDGNAAAAFKDLKRLSRVFKDQLAYPLIAAAREAMSLPVAFGLPVLPPELLLRVLRLLDVRSLLLLAASCRRFYTAAAEPSLWKHFLHRDFPGQYGETRTGDWKEAYKRSFLSRVRGLHRPPRHLPRPFLGGVPLGRVPPPLGVPGIIGGEYDQSPAPFPPLPPLLLPRPRYDPIGPLDGRPRPRPGRPSRPDVRRGFI